jgi:hypothetical protein
MGSARRRDIVGTGGLYFLFTYYFWSDGRLTIHRMEFASPKEFLDYALDMDGSRMPEVEIPKRPGADFSWW